MENMQLIPCTLQILTSALLVLITVTLMLPVPTLLVASPVPVTRDTLEMGRHVGVSGDKAYDIHFIASVLLHATLHVLP